ncbi:MAG: hypothetical protein KDA24_05825 [Deltaproteobacteria bacterium]|nr:hypothetical protein [Deltaproteobacteria bacterium]
MSSRALRRGAHALLVVALLCTSCLDSCSKDPSLDPLPEDETRPYDSGPPAMSPGTLRALGPHIWDASLDIRGDKAGLWPSREVVSKLVWADIDRSLFEEISGGRLQREIRVGEDAYRAGAHDMLYRKNREPGGNTIIQLRTLSLWDQALGGFARQLGWRRIGADTVDGRPVTVWKIELAPPPALDTATPLSPDVAAKRLGLATKPIRLAGTVYVDDATGNRLLAELEGRFVAREVVGGRDPTDEVMVTYRERRSLSAVPPTVEAPPPEQIFVRRTRLPTGGR